jgi:hypothetical protein
MRSGAALRAALAHISAAIAAGTALASQRTMAVLERVDRSQFFALYLVRGQPISLIPRTKAALRALALFHRRL